MPMKSKRRTKLDNRFRFGTVTKLPTGAPALAVHPSEAIKKEAPARGGPGLLWFSLRRGTHGGDGPPNPNLSVILPRSTESFGCNPQVQLEAAVRLPFSIKTRYNATAADCKGSITHIRYNKKGLTEARAPPKVASLG